MGISNVKRQEALDQGNCKDKDPGIWRKNNAFDEVGVFYWS